MILLFCLKFEEDKIVYHDIDTLKLKEEVKKFMDNKEYTGCPKDFSGMSTFEKNPFNIQEFSFCVMSSFLMQLPPFLPRG